MTGRGAALLVAGIAACVALPATAPAYTAAGDRLFPATIVLPQNAPSDDLYFATGTQPLHSATQPGASDRLTNGTIVYDKTITERFSVGIADGYSRFDQASGAGTASGWQNFTTTFQYLAVLDPDHEFLLSLGAERDWGGTGAQGIGASASGATTSGFYFGKGLGEAAAPWLRPFAITGNVGYQIADQSRRANLLQTGLAIEYSIPYLAAKVETVTLPDFFRAMTPMVEMLYTTPLGSPRGATTAGIVAPGINYAAEGWEFGLVALIPATRAAGSGVGVAAQLHLSLDYLFPESIGRPIFSRR